MMSIRSRVRPLAVFTVLSTLVLSACQQAEVPNARTAGGMTAQRAVPATQAVARTTIRQQTDWLLQLQLKEPEFQPGDAAYGALPMHDTQLFSTPGWMTPSVQNELKIEPYFANLAMTGLIDANPKDKVVQTAVKRWMQWYFNNMSTSLPSDPRCADPNTRLYISECDDIPGTVTWHFVNPTTKLQTKVMYMDSADSYAATFITLLHKYYLATGDRAFLESNRSKIRMIRNVFVYDTWDQGKRRTNAKPSYPIDYLMDNTEVYEGLLHLKAMESEVGLLNDTRAQADNEALIMQYRLNDLTLGLESLYYAPSGLYFTSGDSLYMYTNLTGEERLKYLPDINTFYPDATAQLFPIWSGVTGEPPASSGRAGSLWQKFNATWDRPDTDPQKAQHQWTRMDIPDTFPWAVMAYTAARMNDTPRATSYLNQVNLKFGRTQPFPWYNAEAGWALRAAADLINPSSK